MKTFQEQRRQQFLVESFLESQLKQKAELLAVLSEQLKEAGRDPEDLSGAGFFLADLSYRRFSLRYTAGESIESLRGELEQVVSAYERYATALRIHEQSAVYPVFGFQEIDEFERMAQLVGLAYLLHRRDLIPRLHALIAGSAYDGVDGVYEELIGHVIADRPYLDQWYHQIPYVHLLNATDEDTREGKTKELDAYCLAWYKPMKEAPWHDGHLRIEGENGDYFGYWAFEAGAVALLYEIDDSTITHMVYPKDLVAWSRDNIHLRDAVPDAQDRGRVEAGQPCPREGWWLTPAKSSSRRFFKAGEIMPKVQTDYGDIIWQWDTDQVDPTF